MAHDERVMFCMQVCMVRCSSSDRSHELISGFGGLGSQSSALCQKSCKLQQPQERFLSHDAAGDERWKGRHTVVLLPRHFRFLLPEAGQARKPRLVAPAFAWMTLGGVDSVRYGSREASLH